jgi:serine/threonine-protein kinase
MFRSAPIDIDGTSPPFDQFKGIHWLAAVRAGAAERARHQLYVARDKRTRANVVIKVTSKPGLIYEQDVTNEIATLSTINRERPDSRYFPVLGEHGRLRDGRVYLTMSHFSEWPVATAVGWDRIPARLAAHLRTTIEVTRALTELHGLQIWHVDLNPMNILCRWESGRPLVRIVDFESSYEVARHSNGAFYNPPTTSGYSGPELSSRAPDARSDLFSLGAVLYTLLAGHEWTCAGDVGPSIDADSDITPDLKRILLRAVDVDPDKRFASAAAFGGALAAHLERTSPGRP